METNDAGCFFRRPFMGWIQAVCKRLLIFQLFLFVAVYTSLTACCPLSNSLPRERGRVAVGIKGSARKTGCAGCFLLFRRPFKRSRQAACTLIIFKNPIKISRLIMCRLLFIPAAALRHYTPNAAGSGRLKRVYTSKSSLR